MRTKPVYLVYLLIVASVTLGYIYKISNAASEPNLLTGYYTLMGYEGIATIGEELTPYGPIPPVADYVTTHCRFIDVAPTGFRDYYLRYIIHLPDGATLSQVDVHVADFADSGVFYIDLKSRPWASSVPGSLLGQSTTEVGSTGDTTVSLPNLGVAINNQTTQYWIDISPFDAGSIAGQLCVYGIQITYGYEGSFLPMVNRGG